MSMNLLTRQERIHHRSGHIAVRYGKYILVWGGYIPIYMSMLQRFETDEEDWRFGPMYHYMDEVWAYDCETEIWHHWCTTGDTPPLLSGSAAVVLGASLFVFGGYCQSEDSRSGNSDKLYKLDLRTLEWKLLSPSGQLPTPCDKLAAWKYNNKMYIFGGFGPVPTFHGSFSFQVDPSTVHSSEPRGWNNQLVAYDPSTDTWEWLKTTGTAPSPRAAHACDVTGNMMYLFGGRFLNTRTKDLYYLNLATMQWSPNLSGSVSGPVPRGRSWHSFTFVSPSRAVLYGGLDDKDVILRSCWVLDVEHMEWTHEHVRKQFRRHWHVACITQRRDEIFVIGGSTNKIDKMLRLDLAPKTLLRLCLDAVLKGVPADVWRQSYLPRSLEQILELRFESTLTQKSDFLCNN